MKIFGFYRATRLLISHWVSEWEINSFFFSLFSFSSPPAAATAIGYKTSQGMGTTNLCMRFSCCSSRERERGHILITFFIIYKSPYSANFPSSTFVVVVVVVVATHACHFIAFIKNSFFMFFMLFIKQLLLLLPLPPLLLPFAILMRIYSVMFTLNCFKSIAFEGSQHAYIIFLFFLMRA